MDAVEEIKSRLAIEDVISQYVELKRAGRNYKGLSPFGNERSPSFMVSPEKQIWHDFSSGKGGNMFSFVMEMEGLDFRGALELLARKAGVDLEQYRSRGSGLRGKEKERLYAALELATKFYQVHFSKHKEAWEYVLKKRQFSKETALAWRIGYSPADGDALITFLRSKGYSDTEIKGAGLSAQRYRGMGDMFRGRIMIPLTDPEGRVIGFTARLLRDDPNAPKYINTPQTLLYDKSRHVYGLHFAKDAIRKSKYVVIAEGNLDVIASHQAGIRQVVATAGTALTEQQLKALGRFTPDIRLSFDADSAGLNATERAIPIASKVGVTLSVISIPSGKDPDELIRQDAALWQQAIEHHQYALDWLIDRYQKQLDISGAVGKRQFSDIVLQIVRGLGDPVEQEHYIGRIAELIGVSQGALLTKLATKPGPERQPRQRTVVPQQVLDKAETDLIKTQHHLLALTLIRPELRDMLEPIKPQMLIIDDAKTLRELLEEQPDLDDSSPALRPLADYAKMLSLLYEELYQGLELTELRYEAARLQVHLIDRYVKTQKARIAHELQTADDTRTQALLQAAKRLDSLLKTYKGGA